MRARVIARTPIGYDPFLAGRSVDRVTVHDERAGGSIATVIVKRTVGAGLPAARRELAAYRSGVTAPRAPETLRAPALLDWNEGSGHVELWLEELADEHAGRWPVARFGLAARHIARWDVATSRHPAPAGLDSGYAWAEQHGQPHRVAEAVAELHALRAAPAAEEVMVALDDPGLARTQAMITSTPSRIEALAGFPQTLLHHDLVRSNLFAVDAATTAAIDWEAVGPGPFGADLAPLTVGSVRRGEASVDELPELERVVLVGYEQALTEAGGRAADVRPAYRLALGLRWHVARRERSDDALSPVRLNRGAGRARSRRPLRSTRR